MSVPVDPATGLLRNYSMEAAPGGLSDLTQSLSGLDRGTGVFVPHLPGRDEKDLLFCCRKIRQMGLNPVPHLAARHLPTQSALRQSLDIIAKEGTGGMLLLGGDRDSPAGPYDSALSVIRAPVFAKYPIPQVMVGAHPEGHPTVPDKVMEHALLEKLGALEEMEREVEIVSQFAFDSAVYLDWLARLRSMGINNRVRLGMAGVTSRAGLIKYSLRCGVGPSLSMIRKRHGAVLGLLGDYKPDDLLDAIASALPTDQWPRTRLHFFAFGGIPPTLAWIDRRCGPRMVTQIGSDIEFS